MDAASQGDTACSQSDYPRALVHYTTALLASPRAPAYYIKRSTAFSRLKPADSLAALRDAEIAVILARERGKRELILAAQMRRGVALFQLGRFGDADFVFRLIEEKLNGQYKGSASMGAKPTEMEEKVMSAMAVGNKSGGAKHGFEQELPIWLLKVRGRLEKLAREGSVDETVVGVNVGEVPEGVLVPGEGDLRRQLERLKGGKGVEQQGVAAGNDRKSAGSEETAAKKTLAAAHSSPAAAVTTTAPGKVRHEWYQSQDQVVVTLYIKGIPKDQLDVDLKSESASLQFPLPSGAHYDFTLDPLFAPIEPFNSKATVMSTKIELTLRKRIPGQKWSALESTSCTVKLADRHAATAAPTPSKLGANTTIAPGPVYPTSSRHGAKDWDKLASTLTAKTSQKSDAKNKLAEDDGDDEGNDSDGADAVDSFFKKLYANADPDTRRAMMKSYVESQGTSLSTNWEEVRRGPVNVRPPSE
ncbi:co-chaperone SGT1 [Aspergillus saccharolyticus JOP 1030-1]|uniref:SGS-domain-containing protein n=1 Tax=Aspergillus saccharolyticus JOP 1030-1 TaxID=1450539 RepID=A0A318Z6P1_9EURO|nr:SGS-domain-containing protein [Aspergillus saccharolyticus JOP 1030-1]PYH42769.1 SGS-domain-containing protein [Aspergillus saccharolyticus JOP 1030-1]